jgi:hypothetical protein
VFLAVAARLLVGQFVPSRRKPILFSPLAVSMFGFGVIAFAKNMRAQFSPVAELFGYFIGIAIVMILVLLMPPFRSMWLSNLIAR